jgi:hypothetical protein
MFGPSLGGTASQVRVLSLCCALARRVLGDGESRGDWFERLGRRWRLIILCVLVDLGRRRVLWLFDMPLYGFILEYRPSTSRSGDRGQGGPAFTLLPNSIIHKRDTGYGIIAE